MRRKISTNIIIPLENNNGSVPIIRVKMFDKNYYGIVDTGSEISLLSNKLVEKFKQKYVLKEHSMPVILTGVAGKSEDTITTIECRCGFALEYGNITYIDSFCSHDMSGLSSHFKSVCGHDISFIIGSDWLKKHSAEIDYVNNTLHVKYP